MKGLAIFNHKWKNCVSQFNRTIIYISLLLRSISSHRLYPNYDHITSKASLRFKKRQNFWINPRKLSIFYRYFPNRSEALIAEATGLGFVCFVVLNPRVLSANRVDFGFFLFQKLSNFTPPPSSLPVPAVSIPMRLGAIGVVGWIGEISWIAAALRPHCLCPREERQEVSYWGGGGGEADWDKLDYFIQEVR